MFMTECTICNYISNLYFSVGGPSHILTIVHLTHHEDLSRQGNSLFSDFDS
jgi:hypothetical protein